MRNFDRVAERFERALYTKADVPEPPPVTGSWAIRSTLPGTISADNIASEAYFNTRLFYGVDPSRRTYYNTSVKLTGGGSVEMYFPNGHTGPGGWNDYMHNWDTIHSGGVYIRQNREVFVQWNTYFPQVFVDGTNNDQYPESNIKNHVLTHGHNAYPQNNGYAASNTANQTVVQDRKSKAYASMFHGGQVATENYEPLNTYIFPGFGEPSLTYQNVRNLARPTYFSGGNEMVDPFPYVGDAWNTFLLHIKHGPYAQAVDSLSGSLLYGYTDSKIRLFAGVRGLPMQCVIREEGVVFQGMQPNANGCAIQSCSGTTVVTETPHGRSNGNTVWIYDTLTAWDGNSYQITGVTSNSFTLVGAPSVTQDPVTGAGLGGSLWYVFNTTDVDDEQFDPSLGCNRFFVFPTGLTTITAPDTSIYQDEYIASREPIPVPGNEPPPYVQALAPLEGKRLTTVQAGGYADPLSAFQDTSEWIDWSNSPPPGQGSATAHFANAWIAWSGGAGDGYRNMLYVHGGGHNDSAWNGIMRFDCNSDDGANPNGWTLLPNSLSPTSAVRQNSVDYADGLPTSIHSYDGCYVETLNNRFYRWMGSSYTTAGGGSAYHGYYDLNSGQWVNTPQQPSNPRPATTHFYDPIRNRTMYINRSLNRYYVYNNDTLSYVPGREDLNVPGSGGYSGSPSWTSAFDYTRRRGLSIGGNGNHFLVEYWDARDDLMSGRVTIGGVPGGLNWRSALLFYDQYADCYWAYWPRNEGNSLSNLSNLYKCDAATLQWTTYTITGELPSFASPTDSRGHYQRGVLLADWRALVFSPDYNQPAYMIKLPGVEQ